MNKETETVKFDEAHSYYLYTEKAGNGFLGSWRDLTSQETGGSGHPDKSKEDALISARVSANANHAMIYHNKKTSPEMQDLKDIISGKKKS